MSLVNDMLRDLDRRKRSPDDQAARVNNVMRGAPAVAANRWLLGLAVVVSVVAGMSGGYFLFTRDDTVSSQQAAVAAISSAAAVTPAATTAAAPVAVTTQTVPPVLATADANQLDIVLENNSEQGFTLRIKAGQSVKYSIVSRDTYGITLHLDGIGSYLHGNDAVFNGMSVLLASDGANIDFDLELATDFMVYEDLATTDFDIVLSGNYRLMEPAVSASFSETEQQQPVALAIQTPEQGAVAVPQPATAPDSSLLARLAGMVGTSQPQTIPASERSTPVRTAREQTLEQRDRSTSSSAITKARNGQLLEAYQSLLEFVGENPQAVLSRETLATLLYAQQDLVQAESVIDDGLQLTPNYPGFKKIKARMLMQAGDKQAALALLSAVPPPVAEDTEYFELQASLQQQSGLHELAIANYQNLLRLNAKTGRWWTGLAISLEAQNSRQDALVAYQMALQSADLDASLRQYSQNKMRALGQAQ